LKIKDKLAYPCFKSSSLVPMSNIGTAALQASLSDPITYAYHFFSEPSEVSSEPAERGSGREMKKEGSCRYGMSLLLLSEPLRCLDYEAISSLTETAIL
jgi:hypothetical protein